MYAHAAFSGRIQGTSGLVKCQNSRLLEQSTGDGEPLALAAAQAQSADCTVHEYLS